MGRAPLVLFTALVAACGARSELDVGEVPPHDAGSTLDTLPCRWGVGEPLELARGGGFRALEGAIEARADVALVSAHDGEASVGALVTLSQSPVRRASFDGAPGRLLSGGRGFLRQDGGACGAILHAGDTLAELERFTWGTGRCTLAQSRAGTIDSMHLGVGGDDSAAVIVEWPLGGGPVADTLVVLERGYGGGVLVRARDDDYFFAVHGAGSASFGRLTPGRTLETEARAAEALSAAPDRLRGGAVFLYRSPERGWQLVHVDALLRETPVTDLEALRAAPIGRAVTNETEVLLPLSDGSFAYVPLNRTLIRYVAPFAEGPVEAMEIFLRPGASGGVVLYAHRTEVGDAALVYRTLVCNR